LKADQRALVDLAASVADGHPVDWSQAESREDAAGRRLVGHLRLVESIANLHKSIPEDRRLTNLAASVADGAAVDWNSAEVHVTPLDRRLIRHLRLVENIATLHRTISQSDDGDIAQAGLVRPPSDAEPDSEAAQGPSGPRWGRLVLLDRVGQGMSSEVFRAWDSTLHQEVALKLLHEEGADVTSHAHARLLEEARRLARVRHNHVVQVYGADQHDGRVGLWMELVRGESLEQLVKVRGPFGDREAALIGLDLCAALAAVHGAGLLHRDVKAQNVMREQRGRIVLMDFGTGEELAGTNRLVGTPLYLAPEILEGGKASVQSDLYSVGVLLFHLVTGQFPVTALSLERLADSHAQGARRPVRDLRPDLPEAFVEVIERVLDPDLTRRYKTAGELEAALRHTLTPAVQPTVVARPAPMRRPRLQLGLAATAALMVALIVALIVWTRSVESGRGTVVSEIRKIAVTPMVDLTNSAVPPHFAKGLSEELIATLGQVHALMVKPALFAEKKERSIGDLARELDVDAVLETTLAEGSGSPGGAANLRVHAKLLAAGTQGVVWSKTFERQRGQILEVQAQISKEIAKAVGAAVTDAENTRLGSARQTSAGAEEAYLLGKIQLNRYGTGSAELALQAFERALKIDPQYAPAYAGAAWANISLGQNGLLSHTEARARAQRQVRQAMELNAGLSDAHAIQGYIHFLYDWDWEAAEGAFLRSIELNPNSSFAHGLFINYLEALGRFDEALTHAETGRRLDPESGIAARRYALVLYYKGDHLGAEQALARAAAIEPNAAGTWVLQGRIDEALGRLEQARMATRRALELSNGGGVPLKVQAIRLDALVGRRAEARAQLDALQRDAASRRLRLTARDLAYVHLAFGNRDQAVEFFSQAVDDRDSTIAWLAVDPRLQPLHDDQRFRQLLIRMRLPLRP
jgi:TolB-like protein/Flp pilus assembly protein TadD